MIHYTLKCEAGHGFDSWFQSAAAFDTLRKAGHLRCETCGSTVVEKAVMAPRVNTAEAPERPLRAPRSEAERSLARLRREIEEKADYVGPRFASEARAMFLGGQPHRPIYGEASGAEAKALIEDGVPVAPLPFVPKPKAN